MYSRRLVINNNECQRAQCYNESHISLRGEDCSHCLPRWEKCVNYVCANFDVFFRNNYVKHHSILKHTIGVQLYWFANFEDKLVSLYLNATTTDIRTAAHQAKLLPKRRYTNKIYNLMYCCLYLLSKNI